MKRSIMTAILFFAALASCRGALSGDVSVRLLVNNREKKLVPPAVIRNGKAYVGLRGITKVLGGCTKWDEKSKTAVITVGNKRARVAFSDGVSIDGLLFLPLRKTGEAVGSTVEWDSSQRAIKITSEVPCAIGGG